jgi:DNA polymerase-3 subunit epsilon
LAGLPLVAHNSPFDEGCLKAAFRQYGMAYPDYRFFCTCRASRRVFGRELPNHQLQTVAARCGFDLRDHHHALSGNQWKNCRELHVGGDFLLIYRIEPLSKFEMVVFVRTGTHSELFK